MAELKYPLSLVIRAVDRVTAPLQAINARLEKSTSRLSAPFRRLGNRLSALSNAAGIPKVVAGFRGVGEAAGNVGGAVRNLGGVITGMVGGALFGGYGLYALAKGAIDAGDRLGEIAQRVGLSVDAYAQLEFAAAQADVGPEAFASAMDRVNKELGMMKAGGGSLLEFLKKVSPALARQVKGAKNTEEAVGLLTSAFERVTDPGKRAALAAAAFGKSGLQMGQFLGQGSKAIAEQRKRYLELAGSQEALAAGAGGLDNAMREAETAFLGLRNATATALFPALTKLATAVAGFVAKNRDGLAQWATAAGEAITKWVEGGGLERLAASAKEMAAGIASLVDRLGGLGNVVKIIGGLLSLQLVGSLAAAASAMWGFTVALLANPIGLVIVAIAALAGAAYLIYKNWEPIKAFFGRVWETIRSGWTLIGGWVFEFLKAWTPLGLIAENWEPIKSYFTTLWDTVSGIFTGAWETIRPIVESLKAVFQVSAFGRTLQLGTSFRETLFGDAEPARPLGAAQAAPGAARGGEARVTVDFANLPRGARVTPAKDNTAPLDLSLGYSMVTP